MNNPLISVIVPVYNVEKYLDRCVESIVNQTYKNLEIILVDDGSPDNCPKMCDEWAKKDNRIKVVHKQNGGAASTRNAGLDVFTGEYVFFVDSDDTIVDNAIEYLLSIIYDNSCDMAVGRYVKVTDNVEESVAFTDNVNIYSETEYWQKYYEYYYSGKDEYAITMIIPCCKLINRKVFNDLRFDEGKFYEDEFIIHSLVSKCSRIAFVDSKLYMYYQYQTSIMHRKGVKNSLDAVEALERRLDYFIEKNMPCIDEAVLHYLSALKNLMNAKYKPFTSKNIITQYRLGYKKYINYCNLSKKQRLVCTFMYYFPNTYYLVRKIL